MHAIEISSTFYLKFGEPSKDIHFPFFQYGLYSIGHPILTEILDPDYIALVMGIRKNVELEDNPFFYWIYETVDFDSVRIQTESSLRTITQFLSCLWFVKDNSCSCNTVIAFCSDERFSERDIELRYKNSAGEFSDTFFSLAELNEALEYYNYLDNLFLINQPFKPPNGLIENSSIEAISSLNSHNRIQRAYQLLGNARNSIIVSDKIANYIIILECLFSTKGGSEISHTISQNTANYIGINKSDKKEIYRLIKRVYNIRSKYVHGQQLDKKDRLPETQIQLSQKLDEIIRKIFRKILKYDIETFIDDNKLDYLFEDLLFSDPPKLTEKISDIY
ncbi:HEPN domain-containing protein [Larkinella sp. C7]|uniref:HEPN domain-containing protein n=1 Tax=Larkinella sp. C7 TaxID=2576607 RepID=UPI0011116012|nr:HEPN domain-containing protein [Larkinella sp. C7]